MPVASMPIASIHFADVGSLKALRTGAPRGVDGLIHGSVGVAAPLDSATVRAPFRGRLALAATWESDDALDRFLGEHRFARHLAGGWHARLDPLRIHGRWPGVPADLTTDRSTPYEGPALVLTLGRTRLSQLRRFLKTSRPAEAAAQRAPGLLWGTAMAKLPFVGTCSIWESSAALARYAYGRSAGEHPDAIRADETKPFHKTAAFIRFRPYGVEGSLSGVNPLPTSVLDDVRVGRQQ